MHILNTISVKLPVRFWGEGQWDGGGGVGGEIKRVTKPCAIVTPCCAATVSKFKRKTKPCWLLGGFSGEAGETTIAIGDEAVASDSPVGKDNPLRKSKTQDAEAL